MSTSSTKKLRAACNECHAAKSKCSREQPCATCARLGIACVYGPSNRIGRPRGSLNKKAAAASRRDRPVEGAPREAEAGPREGAGPGPGPEGAAASRRTDAAAAATSTATVAPTVPIQDHSSRAHIHDLAAALHPSIGEPPPPPNWEPFDLPGAELSDSLIDPLLQNQPPRSRPEKASLNNVARAADPFSDPVQHGLWHEMSRFNKAAFTTNNGSISNVNANASTNANTNDRTNARAAPVNQSVQPQRPPCELHGSPENRLCTCLQVQTELLCQLYKFQRSYNGQVDLVFKIFPAAFSRWQQAIESCSCQAFSHNLEIPTVIATSMRAMISIVETCWNQGALDAARAYSTAPPTTSGPHGPSLDPNRRAASALPTFDPPGFFLPPDATPSSAQPHNTSAFSINSYSVGAFEVPGEDFWLVARMLFIRNLQRLVGMVAALRNRLINDEAAAQSYGRARRPQHPQHAEDLNCVLQMVAGLKTRVARVLGQSSGDKLDGV